MLNGYENEHIFINNLNDYKFKDLNILLQEVILYLYPNISDNDIIKAYKYGRYAKADIVVSVNDIKYGISLKVGHKNSIHLESIKRFTNYLSNIDVSNEIIDIFLRYIYSDGTNNNTGKVRLSNKIYLNNNQDDIVKLNNFFNTHKSVLIKRFLIDTYVNYKIKANIFIHGTVNDFIWISAEEAQTFLENIINDSKSVHCGNLYIQNWNKNILRNNKYEHCREYIQIKWFSLYDDMIRIIANRKK